MALPATEPFTGVAAALSGTWTQHSAGSTATINKNGSGVGVQSAVDASADPYARDTGNTYGLDQYSQVVIKGFGNGYCETTVRASGNVGTFACYALYSNGANGAGNTELVVWSAGAPTVLCNFSPAAAFAANDVMKIQVIGSVITCYKNGVVMTPSTGGTSVTNTVLSGASSTAGIGSAWPSGVTAPTFDDWEGGNAGGIVVGSYGTRRVGNARGPFDRLGFLKSRAWDYSTPSSSAPPITSDGDLALAPSMSMAGSGIAGIIGAGAMALAVAMSGTGQQTESGTGNLTVPTPVLAGTGQQTESGSGSLAIGTPVLAGAGQQTTTGTGSIALSLSMDGTGIRGNLGSGSLAVATPSVSGSGQQTESGSGDLRIAITLAGTGQQTESGSGSLAIAQVLAGIGQQTESGSGSLAIGTPQLSGSGTTTDAVGGNTTGSGDLAVSLSQSGTGQQTESGSGDLGVSLALSGSGQQTESGTGSLALALSLSGSGTTAAEAFTGTGTLAVPPLSLSGSGQQTTVAVGDLAIPAPTLAGQGAYDIPITGTGDLAVALSMSGSVLPDDTIGANSVFGLRRRDRRQDAAQREADNVVLTPPETFHAHVWGEGKMWVGQPDISGTADTQVAPLVVEHYEAPAPAPVQLRATGRAASPEITALPPTSPVVAPLVPDAIPAPRPASPADQVSSIPGTGFIAIQVGMSGEGFVRDFIAPYVAPLPDLDDDVAIIAALWMLLQ